MAGSERALAGVPAGSAAGVLLLEVGGGLLVLAVWWWLAHRLRASDFSPTRPAEP
jgi:hypothetical protein